MANNRYILMLKFEYMWLGGNENLKGCCVVVNRKNSETDIQRTYKHMEKNGD